MRAKSELFPKYSAHIYMDNATELGALTATPSIPGTPAGPGGPAGSWFLWVK